MNTQSLLELYQKLIQGTSSTNDLINPRTLSHKLKDYTPDQIATIRFSQQYRELLTNQKTFQKTFESLTYIYNTHYGLKQKQRNYSPQFHQFLFEHLFSQQQKLVLHKIIQNQFTTKKSSNNKSDSIKSIQQMLKNVNQGKSFKKQQNSQKNHQKHIFCQLLESILYDEQMIIQKKIAQKKEKTQKTKNQQQFSVGKMMSLLM